MKRAMNDIIGLTMQDIVIIHDYTQIIMDKATINVYGSLLYYRIKEQQQMRLDFIEATELINLIVSDVAYKAEKYLRIILAHKYILEISLQENDYKGPKAISIHYKTGEIVVI